MEYGQRSASVLALAAIALSPLGSIAEEQEIAKTPKPSYSVNPLGLRPYGQEKQDPPFTNNFTASYTQNHIEKGPIDVNKYEGFMLQTLEYSDLEFKNWLFYNQLAFKGKDSHKVEHADTALDLTVDAVKRTANDLDIYRELRAAGEGIANGMKDYAVENIAHPTLSFILGDTLGNKVSGFLFPDISFNLGLSGDPMNIRDPITEKRNYDVDVDFGKVTFYLGGKNRFALQLKTYKIAASFRDYPIGPGKFSASASVRESTFSPTSGDFKWSGKFALGADVNYRISFSNGFDVALGAATAKRFGNVNPLTETKEVTNTYIVGTYSF